MPAQTWILGPLRGEPSRARFRRLAQLGIGLFGFGASLALMVRARLGLGPWDVFHQGLARRYGIGLGVVVVVVSALVLLLWIPLRQRPGLGTVANVFVVGLSVSASLAFLPSPATVAGRALFLGSGIVANGIATGLYIGAGLGPGPRDGLMTGLAARGIPIALARALIELSVLGVGWVLGGTVGIGTLLYALAIGPLAHFFLPRLSLASQAPAVRRARVRTPKEISLTGHDGGTGRAVSCEGASSCS